MDHVGPHATLLFLLCSSHSALDMACRGASCYAPGAASKWPKRVFPPAANAEESRLLGGTALHACHPHTGPPLCFLLSLGLGLLDRGAIELRLLFTGLETAMTKLRRGVDELQGDLLQRLATQSKTINVGPFWILLVDLGVKQLYIRRYAGLGPGLSSDLGQ